MRIQAYQRLGQQLGFLLVRGSLFTATRLAPKLAQPWAMRLFAQPAGPRKIRYDFRKYPIFHELKLDFQPSYRSRQHRLQCYAWGRIDDRPTVLLVHGWGGWGLQMAYFVKPLLDLGYAVITVDMPAHGKSSGKLATLPLWRDALLTLMHQYPRIQTCIAHSFGGMAIRLALSGEAVGGGETPSLKRLILLGALADLYTPMQYFKRTMWLSARTMQGVQAGWEKKLATSFDRFSVAATPLREVIPTLLIYDRHDEIVDQHHLQVHQAQWPHAEIELTEEISHLNLLRAPQVIARVERFMQAMPA
jgi:pimeloyl-ACP methyl ester carboxylesterase